MRPTIATWQDVTRELRVQAESAAAQQIPNPFRPGDPLTPEQGQEVFRGRIPQIRRIEALLGNPQQSSSIALRGLAVVAKPRCCMLPTLLPDTICVFFDLQDNPVTRRLLFLPPWLAAFKRKPAAIIAWNCRAYHPARLLKRPPSGWSRLKPGEVGSAS